MKKNKAVLITRYEHMVKDMVGIAREVVRTHRSQRGSEPLLLGLLWSLWESTICILSCGHLISLFKGK